MENKDSGAEQHLQSTASIYRLARLTRAENVGLALKFIQIFP